MSLTSTIPFEKYHGTAKDFIVVDASHSVPNRPAFAKTYCDRTDGVTNGTTTGADGVLFLALEETYDPPRVVMTLVQPDGSVAAMCGNAARCAAAWAADRTGSDRFMIDTPAGTPRAVVDGETVEVEMGVPSFDPRDVPLARETPLVVEQVEGLTVTAVNTGVPHAVAFVDDVDDVDLETVAPPIRHADVFPRGTNVTVASQETDTWFRERTFERGVEGETQSSGMGAVALVAAAKRIGIVDTEEFVRVSPPGGDLSVSVPDHGDAVLRGPVVREYAGELAVVDPATNRP